MSALAGFAFRMADRELRIPLWTLCLSRAAVGPDTDIPKGRRSITADTAMRLGRYFGNRAQFWLDLQSQHDIAVVERERGKETARRVRPRRRCLDG